MSTLPREAAPGQTLGPLSMRAGMTVAMALFCLTTPRVAYAHDDDAPATPEKFWTGVALFMLVSLMLLVAAFRARLPARRRLLWSRYRRKLKRRRP